MKSIKFWIRGHTRFLGRKASDEFTLTEFLKIAGIAREDWYAMSEAEQGGVVTECLNQWAHERVKTGYSIREK